MNATGVILGWQSLIAWWSENSQQLIQEATDVATRIFLTTVKAVPAGFVRAAGRIVSTSDSHRTARWKVFIWTERHAARVFIDTLSCWPCCSSQMEISQCLVI